MSEKLSRLGGEGVRERNVRGSKLGRKLATLVLPIALTAVFSQVKAGLAGVKIFGVDENNGRVSLTGFEDGEFTSNSIDLGARPEAAAINGNDVYVVDGDGSRVFKGSMEDLSDVSLLAEFLPGSAPVDVIVSGDGSKLFTANVAGNNIARVDSEIGDYQLFEYNHPNNFAFHGNNLLLLYVKPGETGSWVAIANKDTGEFTGDSFYVGIGAATNMRVHEDSLFAVQWNHGSRFAEVKLDPRTSLPTDQPDVYGLSDGDVPFAAVPYGDNLYVVIDGRPWDDDGNQLEYGGKVRCFVRNDEGGWRLNGTIYNLAHSPRDGHVVTDPDTGITYLVVASGSSAAPLPGYPANGNRYGGIVLLDLSDPANPAPVASHTVGVPFSSMEAVGQAGDETEGESSDITEEDTAGSDGETGGETVDQSEGETNDSTDGQTIDETEAETGGTTLETSETSGETDFTTVDTPEETPVTGGETDESTDGSEQETTEEVPTGTTADREEDICKDNSSPHCGNPDKLFGETIGCNNPLDPDPINWGGNNEPINEPIDRSMDVYQGNRTNICDLKGKEGSTITVRDGSDGTPMLISRVNDNLLDVVTVYVDNEDDGVRVVHVPDAERDIQIHVVNRLGQGIDFLTLGTRFEVYTEDGGVTVTLEVYEGGVKVGDVEVYAVRTVRFNMETREIVYDSNDDTGGSDQLSDSGGEVGDEDDGGVPSNSRPDSNNDSSLGGGGCAVDRTHYPQGVRGTMGFYGALLAATLVGLRRKRVSK